MVASNGPDMYPASAVGSNFMDALLNGTKSTPKQAPPFRTEEDFNNMNNPMSMPGFREASMHKNCPFTEEAWLERKVKRANDKLARKQLKAKRKKGRH
jgi:hypothetical protein